MVKSVSVSPANGFAQRRRALPRARSRGRGLRACGPRSSSCRAAMLLNTMRPADVRQHERERRGLDDRIEQQLALMQIQPLAPQQLAERVVGARRARRSSSSRGVADRNAEVVIAEARDAVRQRLHHVGPGPRGALREPHCHGHDEHERCRQRQPRRQPASEQRGDDTASQSRERRRRPRRVPRGTGAAVISYPTMKRPASSLRPSFSMRR